MIQKKSILAACCAAALISTGGAFSSMAEPMSSLRIQGPVTENSGSSLIVDNQSQNSFTGDIVIHISEDTKVLNAVSGMPTAADQISSGETVYVYVSPAMTMSLPPQTTAELILADIPADYKVPDYIEVASMDAVDGGYRLTSTDGLTFQVPADCPISPYLTRNMLYLENLYSGAHCLVWSDNENNATRIMMFQPTARKRRETTTPSPLCPRPAGFSPRARPERRMPAGSTTTRTDPWPRDGWRTAENGTSSTWRPA